ncbi:MAG: N-acetyltransferase [Chitinophagaceae bacterium]|nr:N-acetyltransferase [Chitinophagaceae bacterium]
MEIITWHEKYAPAIIDIYQHGIDTGNATFETEVPSWDKINAKFHTHSRLLAMDMETVLGWAAIGVVSPRECYSGVAEVTIYVHKNHHGQGIGKQLLKALIEHSEQNQIWTLVSVIHEENRASIHLHDQCGFRLIGYRERIAQLGGDWKTTVMMERRSTLVGI